MSIFIKIIFLAVLSCVNPLSATPLSCISMNNQECKVRPEIFNVNSDEPAFYLFSIKTSKCRGNGNNVIDPYAKMCVPDVIKNRNVKVFNLMSRTNETRHVNVNLMQVLVIIKNMGMMINVDANVKN